MSADVPVSQPASGAPAPHPAAAPDAPGADSAAAEPSLKDRSSELARVARQERAKLAAREKERAERVALESRVREAEAHAKRLAELEKRIADDPLGLLNERGVTARSIAERVVKEGTPDAKLEELSAKYQKLVEDRERERAELQAKVHREEQQRAFESARKQLHDTFASVKDKLPILSRLLTSETRIEREYMAAWQTIQADPEASRVTWTDAEIFEAMEAAKAADRDAFIHATDADELEKVLTSKRAPATVDEKSTPGSVRQATENAGTSSAKTLTNGQAAARVSADEGFEIRKGETLAQADKRQNRELAERLRQSRRG